MVFSAHTHELTQTPVTKSGDGLTLYAPVVDAGNDAYLGRLDVTTRYKDSTTTRFGSGPDLSTEQNWGSGQ